MSVCDAWVFIYHTKIILRQSMLIYTQREKEIEDRPRYSTVNVSDKGYMWSFDKRKKKVTTNNHCIA